MKYYKNQQKPSQHQINFLFKPTMRKKTASQSQVQALNDKSKNETLKHLKKALKKQSADPLTKYQTVKTNNDIIKRILRQQRVKKLKQDFFYKLTSNNIYEQLHPPLKLQSQEEIDKKRLIKLQGIELHPHILSTIYIVEIMLIIITFYLSTCLAFIPNFVNQNVQNHPISFGLKIATLITCCLKVAIDSTTRTIDEGVKLTYVTDIVKAYVKSSSLFVDIIYILILISFFFVSNQVQIMHGLGLALFICSVLKILLCRKNLTYFQVIFLNSFKKEKYYKLFKVILFNMIFAHFIASMLLAMAAIDKEQNWMIYKEIDTKSWHIQYMWSIYWATTIMMTVGFGDFLPFTYKEALIIAFVEFFSCIVLAYNISQIGSIISALRASQDQYVAKLGVFKRMAEKNSIKMETRAHIEKHLREQIELKQRFEFHQQDDLLESLPGPLKEKLRRESTMNVFRCLPFFKDLHIKSLKSIAEILKSRIYYPRQTISKANRENKLINILKQGKVGLTYWKKGSVTNGVVVQQIELRRQYYLQVEERQSRFINILSPILLNTEFLSPGKVKNYNTVALTYSYIMQLEVAQFIQTIKQNQIDYQYFLSIIHQTCKWTYQWEQIPCNQCAQTFTPSTKKNQNHNDNNKARQQLKISLYHTKFTCPKLHFLPKKSIIMIKLNKKKIKSIPQKSVKYDKRKKERTSSCLLLSKNSFKLYEEYRSIKKQREIQTFLEQYEQHSESSESSESSQKMYKENRHTFEHRRKKTNKMDVQRNTYLFQKKNTFLNKFLPSRKNQASPQDGAESIINKVAQFSINKLYYVKVSLVFWDLQIDIMYDYVSYFPHENPIRLNQTKTWTKKDETPCIMWGIINYAKNIQGSITAKKHLEPQISQQNFDEATQDIYLRKTQFKESNRSLLSPDKLNDKNEGNSLSSMSPQKMNGSYPMSIKIPTSTKKFDYEFSIDEDSITFTQRRRQKI